MMDTLSEFGLLVKNSTDNLNCAHHTAEEILPEINENTLNCYSVAQDRVECLVESAANAQEDNGYRIEEDSGENIFKHEKDLLDSKIEVKMQGNILFDLKSIKVENFVPLSDIKEDKFLKQVHSGKCNKFTVNKFNPAVNFQPRVVLEKLKMPPNLKTETKMYGSPQGQTRILGTNLEAIYADDSEDIEDYQHVERVEDSHTLGLNKRAKTNEDLNLKIYLEKHLKQCQPKKYTSNNPNYHFNSRTKTYFCQACSYKSHLLARIKQHITRHSDDRPHACGLCEKQYKSVSELNVHRRIHSTDKRFKCEICPYSTHLKGSFNAHLTTHTGKIPFTCPECSVGCKTSAQLWKHRLMHSKRVRFKCEFCPYTTNRVDAFKIHSAAHTGQRIHTCRHCDFSTSLIGEIRKHARTHSSVQIFFPCSKCSLQARSMNELKIHLRTHSGERPYQCEHCGYASAQRSNLRSHLKLHEGKRSFQCAHCSYKAAEKGNLRRHVQTHLTQKQYQCAHCDFTAKAPFYLIPHIFSSHMSRD